MQDFLLETSRPVAENVNQRNIIVLLNFNASITLQTINASQVEDRSNTPTNSTACEETDRTLIYLGGGTLGEIINTCKRCIKLKTISAEQQQQAAHQLALAKMICMTADETQYLPPDLVMRDRGGMYFPKAQFVPFIRKVNAATVVYACDASMKKLGSTLLKVS